MAVSAFPGSSYEPAYPSAPPDLPRHQVDIWSFHYHPEPTGIGPVSRTLATGLAARGHDLSIVAAHPHYPQPMWGSTVLPHRESLDGIPALRLPLWIGRDSALARYRQELSFVAGQFLTMPTLRKPDVVVYASPSFPGLLAPMAYCAARRVPWVLWLQDILPDGAASAGIVADDSAVMRQSRRLELAAYRSAAKIVAISEAFIANLVAKGVPRGKIELLYNPATRERALPAARPPRPRILSMGNIGHSQGLAPLVAAFERSAEMRRLEAELVITGSGVAAGEVRAEVRSDRVKLLGVVDDAELERQLQAATVALVSQRHGGAEFNFPSKLMNFMSYGLPVLAAVDPRSEVARVVGTAGAGWVVDSAAPDDFPAGLARILGDEAELARRGAAALAFAEANFSQAGFAGRFEAILDRVHARPDRPGLATADVN
jgi:colanic acid biosynthesis glycosyl transferase WcaI